MQNAFHTFKLLVSVLRLGEITLMTGFLIIGFFCAVGLGAQFSLLKLTILSSAVFMHFSSIYFFNSYAGFSEDKYNDRINHGMEVGISDKHFLFMSVIILFISLSLYAYLNRLLPILAFVSYVGWLIYSSKKSGLKQVPFAGTAVHFFSQVLHFSMGWIALSTFSYEVLLEGLYFALLFAAGHLNHELIDYEADKKTKVNTGAVTLGKNRIETIYQIISVLTLIYICHFFLYLDHYKYFLVFAPASVIQVIAAFLLKENPLKRRAVYRLTFLLSGLLFIFLTLNLSHWT